MVSTLDYAGFPHIFREVAAYSDEATQHRLRLLSSSAKRDVDKLIASSEGTGSWMLKRALTKLVDHPWRADQTSQTASDSSSHSDLRFAVHHLPVPV